MRRLLPLSVLLLCGVFAGCRTNETPEAQVHDMEITASIKSKMASDVGLSTVPNVSVNSTNGIVTLSGQVDSAATKAKIETLAKSVPHVVRVVNNLQVQTPTSSRVSSPAFVSTTAAG